MRDTTSLRRYGIGAAVVLLLVLAALAVRSTARLDAQAAPEENLRGRLQQARAAFAASGAGGGGGTTTAGGGMLDSVVWGTSSDTFVPADYDGDGKADHAYWRSGQFHIRKSSDGLELVVTLGQSGDTATVIADYDGDGVMDPAVYRSGATAGAYSSWLYYSSLSSSVVTVACGAAFDCGKYGDFPAPGDYNGDGKSDFAVQRSHAGGVCVADARQGSQANFTPNADFIIATNGGSSSILTCIGKSTDVIIPGDFDGDLISDITVTRGVGGVMEWTVRSSSTSGFQLIKHGTSATDFPVPGDYDGDGRTDVAIWRPGTVSAFYVKPMSGGTAFRFPLGVSGDYPVANFNVH